MSDDRLSLESVDAVLAELANKLSHIQFAVCGLAAMCVVGFRSRRPRHISVVCASHTRAVLRSWAAASGMLLDPTKPDHVGVWVDGTVHHVRIKYLDEEFDRLTTFRYTPGASPTGGVAHSDGAPLSVAVLTLPSQIEMVATAYAFERNRYAWRARNLLAHDLFWLLAAAIRTGVKLRYADMPVVGDDRFWQPFTNSYPEAAKMFRKAGMNIVCGSVKPDLLPDGRPGDASVDRLMRRSELARKSAARRATPDSFVSDWSGQRDDMPGTDYAAIMRKRKVSRDPPRSGGLQPPEDAAKWEFTDLPDASLTFEDVRPLGTLKPMTSDEEFGARLDAIDAAFEHFEEVEVEYPRDIQGRGPSHPRSARAAHSPISYRHSHDAKNASYSTPRVQEAPRCASAEPKRNRFSDQSSSSVAGRGRQSLDSKRSGLTSRTPRSSRPGPAAPSQAWSAAESGGRSSSDMTGSRSRSSSDTTREKLEALDTVWRTNVGDGKFEKYRESRSSGRYSGSRRS